MKNKIIYQDRIFDIIKHEKGIYYIERKQLNGLYVKAEIPVSVVIKVTILKVK